MSLALTTSNTLSLRTRPGVAALNCPVASAGARGNEHTTGLSFACVNSTDLLRGQKAVEITHNGLIYRLQATRLGKLILTK